MKYYVKNKNFIFEIKMIKLECNFFIDYKDKIWAISN